jgi:hypothetical protein
VVKTDLGKMIGELRKKCIIRYLNMFYSDMIPKTTLNNNDYVFYVDSDNEIFMEYNKITGHVWIRYNNLWTKIESLFSLNGRETQLIMIHWLKETYNLERILPNRRLIL